MRSERLCLLLEHLSHGSYILNVTIRANQHEENRFTSSPEITMFNKGMWLNLL